MHSYYSSRSTRRAYTLNGFYERLFLLEMFLRVCNLVYFIAGALPEALENGCAKCSKSQLESAIKIIRYLREFEPVKFEILANKFDPKGIYRKRYLDPTPDETNNSITDENSVDENDQKLKRLIKRHRSTIA
uniref:Chemosensory protein 11 n=1 Tax=Chouioia cunea TaxID=1570515 RepID=A0A6B9CLJ0_9HYME|nr:chemosensory protein 11 [Chouioia cunea]